MHNFGKHDAADRSHFTRLQLHGATRGDGGCHFADDLVERPVPRGDQANDANGLANDPCVAALGGELERLQRRDGCFEVDQAWASRANFGRRAHLIAHSLGDLFVARIVDFENLAQVLQAVLPRGRENAGKAALAAATARSTSAALPREICV